MPAYDVTHLYDETGSAKARYEEFLRAADRRRLVDEVRRSRQGLRHRALAGLGDAISALIGRIPRGSGARELACSEC
jgi:hypothetical protein